ncbi:MAG: GNAT family N-acetyltransferase [Clostridiales bacterium]|nr:GNAT family N-acetyltransferase [Clostridiales bacterium]
MEHKGTIRLETERLILRPFVMEDAEAAYRNWTSSPLVTKYLRWPAHGSPDVTRYILSQWISQYASPDFYQWAIVPKETDEPIGTISAVDLDEVTHKVHIGYCIGSQWWRLGYTSEAFAAVIPFFFEQVKALRIESQHDPNNPNSGKVMAKCGLRYEGTLRKADWSNQGIVDACMYGLLAEDYFQTKS